MTHLCSICAARDAAGYELIDGKRRPVCAPCVSEPVPEPETCGDTPADHLLRLIARLPDLTFAEMREQLDIPPGDGRGRRSEAARHANRYAKTLERLVSAGAVERIGSVRGWQTYRIPETQRRAA